MHSHLYPHFLLEIGLFIRRDQEGVSQNHKTNIFHAADSEFRHEDLIILLEREGARKEILKKQDRFSNELKLILSKDQPLLRLTAHDSHGHLEARLILNLMVWTNCKGIDVSANWWANVKNEQVAMLRDILGCQELKGVILLKQ
jgi:hypothetical protein